MRSVYRGWLERQKYDPRTIGTQISRLERVEKHYGDLDEHYARGRLESVIASLRYTSEDKRRGRRNPSTIIIDGDLYTNLASYKNSVLLYRRFLENGGGVLSDSGDGETGCPPVPAPVEDDLGQRVGLERDMQAALRKDIEQLEEGLVVIDDGAERFVESGRIDITARDASGAIVVIELKAGSARQGAVAQILSYMGDVAVEDPGQKVRGILIASDFDKKAVAAARMAPGLSLRTYGVRFNFSKVSA
jgi:endonuclease